MKILLIILLTLSLNAKRYNEQHYADIFCNSVGGIKEYILDDGSRVDCLDPLNGKAWEVDFDGHKVYEAIGQSLYYSIKTGLKPAVFLITKDKNSNSIKRLKIVADKYDISLVIIKE